MKGDINKSKKKRKINGPVLENPGTKKKSDNHEICDVDSSIQNKDHLTPENDLQDKMETDTKKKERKKKKRKIEETHENNTIEKKPKTDSASTSATLQNGATTDSNDPEKSDGDIPEKFEVSNKEASKLSGKSLRKSFNSKEGIDALRKFLVICKGNKEKDLAAEYLQAGGSVLEILRLLDSSDKKNINNASIVFSAMRLIIMKILSEYPQYQANAEEACRHFINSHLSFVHSMLSSQSNAKHRKIVLRLLASIVSLGGSLPRELLGHLSFHSQVLDTLSQHTKPTDSQSVRTCFIHFILAFLIEGNSSVIRALLDKRGMLSCIFPGLIYDSHTTVHLVLDTVKNWVLENQAISKTSKLRVFSTPVVQSLVALYNWKGPKNWPGPRGKTREESQDSVDPLEKEIALTALHNFLTTLLTSNRHGVIFHDHSLGTSGRKHNQLVNTVLQSLDRPWEHSKPRDLVIKILVACPDLVKSQLAYTEPFLEPRASKKWIMTMRFVGDLLDSLNPENCLKSYLMELGSSQLLNAVQNLSIPLTVLKKSIVHSLSDVKIIVRNEAIVLLTKMLKRAKTFGKIVEENCREGDFLSFKHSLIDYVSKNVPSLESILKIWKLALAPEESMEEETEQEEIKEFLPRKNEHITAILDLLQAYRDINPESLDLSVSEDHKSDVLLSGINELGGIEERELNGIKIKALKFLLSVDPGAFTMEKSLFGETLSFLITLLDLKENDEDSHARETLKILLGASGMFEGCIEQMDIWIESFARLDNREEKIHVANWFVKVVYRAIKKTDKFLDLIAEAEELAGEEILSAERMENIFKDLSERDPENFETKVAKVAPLSSITAILCSALESLQKNYDPVVAGYLSRVTILTLHCQVTPGTLVHLTRNVENFPATKYLKSWMPEEKPINVKKLFPSTSSLVKLSKFLLNDEKTEIEKVFQGGRNVEFSYEGKKIIIHYDIGEYDVSILFRMNIFYLTRFIQKEELSEDRFETYKLCTTVLLHIAKDLTSNASSKLVYKCSQIFFTHPTLLQYFSPFCKSKYVVEKIVTRGLIDVCRTIIDLNDPTILPDLFLAFKNKLITQLKKVAKKSHDQVQNSLGLLEFIEILQPTTEDIIDVLQTILELPKSNFLIDKTTLSVWGNLVPKLMEMLSVRKQKFSEDLTINASIVKKIVSYLIQLKIHSKIEMDLWEKNLREYLENYSRNISAIDGHMFNSLLKLPKSINTTNLLSFLISRNDQFIPLFVKFVLSNTKIVEQSDFIFPMMGSRLIYSWNEEFLTTIHNRYKNDIINFFSEPTNDQSWLSRNIEATAFLIDSCFEREDCEKACERVLSNGDKLDAVDVSYVKLLESLFKKSSKFENNFEEALTKLVQVLLRIMVSALKKDSKNEEKLEILSKSLEATINHLKSRNRDFIFEDLNKNYCWPQFTRFSLKLGLKSSKNEEKKLSLLKTLVRVCDVAYKDDSENEYVKTLFEMTTSHSEFVNLMLSSHSLKRDLLELLWILVRKNRSILSSSQIPLYLAAYNATLEESDQLILLILQRYEANGIKFDEYRPYLWGEAAATHYSVKGEADTSLWRQPSTSQVLDLLNLEMVKETIKYFPIERKLKPSGLCEAAKVYDPSFYLPLLSYLLSDNNVVACHKVTQSGALALVFSASGSSCPEIRLAAYTVISRFYFHLEAAGSKEKHLWIRFIDALRNGILSLDSSLKNVRISCLVSTFLARASIVTTQPMNLLYSPIQTFLMAKPALELNTIPEFLQLFHSSDIEHQAHRHWILGVIRDGMKTNLDMDIALKCVLFKMLLDFYTSVLSDPITKRLILQVIESTVKIPKAGLLLARNYGLLVWLSEISTDLKPRDTESIEIVVSIVRNILNGVMRSNDRDKDCQFLLLNVLKYSKPCLSTNTSVSCFNAYTSSLGEIFLEKSLRVAFNRDDLEEIVNLGKSIYGDIDDVMDTLRYGGEYSSRDKDIKIENDELAIGRSSLRKLILTWCGHGAR